MIELVFVIVIIGILSAVLAPNFQRDTLQEAASQIVSHIRYTQHLAMMDNKFDSSDQNWFKKRWRLRFLKTAGSDNQWSYTIYSDNDFDGNADANEMAKNSLKSTEYLTGGFSGTVPYKVSGSVNPKISKELNIGHQFGVANITTTNSCRTAGTSTHIAFDNMGRPMTGAIDTLTKPYIKTGAFYLLSLPCDITLIDSDNQSIIIRIEPETGYAHII